MEMTTNDQSKMHAFNDLLARLTLSREKLVSLACIFGEATSIEKAVKVSGWSRRTVEEVIRSLSPYMRQSDGQTYVLSPTAVQSISNQYEELKTLRTRCIEASENPASLRALTDLIKSGPRAQSNLDHVQATAETVMRRAKWLCENFTLDGATLVFVGDHDLTSAALSLIGAPASLYVVDIDEELLSYIDSFSMSKDSRTPIMTRFSDLRSSFPTDLLGVADIFVTDPPYTPEGVELFVSRGISALSSLNGRGLLAYGAGDQMPALALKVQKALTGLDILITELVPDFNVYDGAQALGSRSDWFTLRATSGTKKRAIRISKHAASSIYSRGRRSIEASTSQINVSDIADRFLIDQVVVQQALKTGARALDALALPEKSPDSQAVIDVRRDAEALLARALLLGNAGQMLIIADNNHPLLRSEAGQSKLRRLFQQRWDIRIFRSMPDSRTAIVQAKDIAMVQPVSTRNVILRSPLETLHIISKRSELTDVQRNAIRKEAQRMNAASARVYDLPLTALERLIQTEG